MEDDPRSYPRIPLVPLSDVVHFPCTDLRLTLFEPRYQRLVRDVLRREDDEEPQVGLVLLKPASLSGDPDPGLEFFRAGTLARLLDADFAGARVDVWLHGEQRFELTRDLTPGDYHRATVRLVDEPHVNEADAGIVAVRSSILDLVRSLAEHLGESFPVPAEEAAELASAGYRFEEVVNRIAAELDLPPLRKLGLLLETLPERGLSMLSILRSRQQVVDMLRPFRHLAAGASSN